MSNLLDFDDQVPLHRSVRNRIPALRAQHGWTQTHLASLLGVSRQTVISIEKRKYDPSLPLAFRIASVFGLAIEQIFLPEPAEPPEEETLYAPV